MKIFTNFVLCTWCWPFWTTPISIYIVKLIPSITCFLMRWHPFNGTSLKHIWPIPICKTFLPLGTEGLAQPRENLTLITKTYRKVDSFAGPALPLCWDAHSYGYGWSISIFELSTGGQADWHDCLRAELGALQLCHACVRISNWIVKSDEGQVIVFSDSLLSSFAVCVCFLKWFY